MNHEQILRAMETAAGSIEAANYLVERFQRIVDRSKRKAEFQEVLEKLKDYATLITYKLTNSTDPWKAEFAKENDFITMQHNLANEIAQTLTTLHEDNLYFDYALSDEAHLIRAWSNALGEVEIQQSDDLDKLLNAWLAEHHYISHDGQVFKADAKGNIQKPATATDLRQLIQDDKKGIAAYLAAKNFSLLTNEQPYPTASLEETQTASSGGGAM